MSQMLAQAIFYQSLYSQSVYPKMLNYLLPMRKVWSNKAVLVCAWLFQEPRCSNNYTFTVSIITFLHLPVLPWHFAERPRVKWLPYTKIISEMPHFVLLYQDANYLFLVSQVLAMCLLAEGQQLYLHWSHKVGRGFTGNPNHALNNQPVLFPCMQSSLGHKREGRG